MKLNNYTTLIVALIIFLFAMPVQAEQVDRNFLVYKHPQCGCCSKWIEHLRDSGYRVDHQHLQYESLNALKAKHFIQAEYQSCHTAITADGYVFEGHIPARLIQQFLAEAPEDAIGLAVPGMPVGSPGMEMGSRYDEYDVLLLLKDGTSRIYATVNAGNAENRNKE